MVLFIITLSLVVASLLYNVKEPSLVHNKIQYADISKENKTVKINYKEFLIDGINKPSFINSITSGKVISVISKNDKFLIIISYYDLTFFTHSKFT